MGELLPLIGIGGAVALLFAVLMRIQRGSARGGSALGPFLRHFEAKGVAPEVAATVFRQLQRWMAAQDGSVAVKPEQSLSAVYGLLPEEVEAALLRLGEECGRRRDPTRERVVVTTVHELVSELAAWPSA